MCGIFSVFQEGQKDSFLIDVAKEQAELQRHRGPDNVGIVEFDEGIMIHHRLALVGLQTGQQPLVSKDGNIVLVANCEIYNYKELASVLQADLDKNYIPRSDADVILGLYELYNADFIHFLNGMFAFVLYDKVKKNILIARDHVGILPGYIGYDESNRIWVSSEMKCIVKYCPKINVITPGSFLCGPVGALKKKNYYDPAWKYSISTKKIDLNKLRMLLIKEVESHLEANVIVGCLLSGGLDSSLIAGIAASILKKKYVSGPQSRLITFSVGMKGSPDLEHARQVAEYIKSDHHELVFTFEEGLKEIEDLIWHVETFDVTTVRASVPMYLLAREVKKCKLKAVLSGEGSDEIFGGYLYFRAAPDRTSFQEESVKRVLNISYFDVARANKSMMAWSVELRVPFLSKTFLDYCMDIDPKEKMTPSTLDFQKTGLEKFILRQAFSGQGYIPENVIWRVKEQFSDGVGFSWIDNLKENAEKIVSDEEFSKCSEVFPMNPPFTKEEYFYRLMYEKRFGKDASQYVKRWIPRQDWGCSLDPSGRAQKYHIAYAV